MRTKRWFSGAALLALMTVLTTACSTTAEDLAGATGDIPGPTTEPSEEGVRDSKAAGEEKGASPAAEPRGTEDWRVTRPAAGRISAYTSAISAVPGTRVGVYVSTLAAGYRVSAYRIGSYPGGTGTLVWRSRFLDGKRQASAVLDPVETRTVVAPWRRSLTLDTTGWDPGFYVIGLRTGSGWETAVPYVVRSPSARGTVALVAPVTTWQAYNEWGGHSLYAGPAGDRRSWAVSFDRPFNLATGANDYRTAAIPVIVRAERLGIPLSYYANTDLDEDTSVLEGARGYVSMGHDEYWTPTMRREVESARDAGTNLAFLGANTMYWRVRLDRRTMTGYRHDAYQDPWRETRPAEATSRFRDEPKAEPEHSLVGMQYECYPVDADYRVVSPRWWGFRGTAVSQGDVFGHLVGPESDRVYPDARSPRPLQVLSHSAFLCRGVQTTTQSVYYTTTSGAGVFAAGTLRWGCALVDRCEGPLDERTSRFVHRVTENLLREFVKGPVGTRWPAVHNVDRFDLPVVNNVEAS